MIYRSVPPLPGGCECVWERGLGGEGPGEAGLSFFAFFCFFAFILSASAPAHAAPFVYITNERSGNVTVIDAATDKPLYNLHTGGRPRGIQVSADGRTVYVARSDPQFNKQSPLDSILAIDVAKKRVAAHLDAGSDPEQFAVSRDGKRLYITNEDAGTASVTDLAQMKVTATLV